MWNNYIPRHYLWWVRFTIAHQKANKFAMPKPYVSAGGGGGSGAIII